MKPDRRKKLYVRQSFAYLDGQSKDSSWKVGYWQAKRVFNTDHNFRSFGSRATYEEAFELAQEIQKNNPTEFRLANYER